MTDVCLLDFPNEIIDIISSYLSFHSYVFFSNTCKSLREVRSVVVDELYSILTADPPHSRDILPLFIEAVTRDYRDLVRDRILISFSRVWNHIRDLHPRPVGLDIFGRNSFTPPSIWKMILSSTLTDFPKDILINPLPEWVRLVLFTNSKSENFIQALLVVLMKSRCPIENFLTHYLKGSISPQTILFNAEFFTGEVGKNSLRPISEIRELFHHFTDGEDHSNMERLMMLLQERNATARITRMYPELSTLFRDLHFDIIKQSPSI